MPVFEKARSGLIFGARIGFYRNKGGEDESWDALRDQGARAGPAFFSSP
jgi:hypothetical protein